MARFGGFDGNAQSLRLITEILYSEGKDRKGMNPSRAFLDGILKYKWIRKRMPAGVKEFLYNEQYGLLRFAHSLGRPYKRCSIECQIMTWADDTAYCLGDLIDGARGRFITPDRLAGWRKSQTLDSTESRLLDRLAYALAEERMSSFVSHRIGQFIQGCSLQVDNTPMDSKTNRFRYRLVRTPAVEKESRLYKQVSQQLVFRTPQLQQLEYKGQMILEKIFGALCDVYVLRKSKAGLLPSDTARMIDSEKSRRSRARLVCDYIAGMTDAFAVRMYSRMFQPEFGSLMDLV